MAEIVLAYDYEDEFLQLVKEYTDDIAQQGAEVVNCLATQNLSSELAHVEDKYGLPDGRMYIARVDGIAAGSSAGGAVRQRLAAQLELAAARLVAAFADPVLHLPALRLARLGVELLDAPGQRGVVAGGIARG